MKKVFGEGFWEFSHFFHILVLDQYFTVSLPPDPEHNKREIQRKGCLPRTFKDQDVHVEERGDRDLGTEEGESQCVGSEN
jgi:hypothetical protein